MKTLAGNMTYVHDRSHDCLKAELDLFEAPLTQTSLDRADWIAYPPSATITATSMEFRVPGSGDDYVDLLNSFISLKVKIVNADGSNILEDVNVGPINLFLQSLFSQVEVALNGYTIGHANSLYPYRAILETLINYGPEAAKSHLQSQLFYKDTAGHMEETHVNRSNHLELVQQFHDAPTVTAVDADTTLSVVPAELGNQGLYWRSRFTRGSQIVQLTGPIHHDVFQHERLLLSNVDITINFTRSKPDFALMSTSSSPNFKIEILEALLYMRKVKVADHVALSHQAALTKCNCIYPINHVMMKSFSIPAGNLNLGQDYITMGTLPQELIVVFVNNVAASGNYMRNPFNFKHMNIQQIVCKYAGLQVPAHPLALNFDDSRPGGGQYERALQMLFASTGKTNQDKGCIIERQDFPRGYAIFAWDFRPDMDSRGYYSLKKQGLVQLEVQFRQPLVETVTMIVMASYDSYFEINKTREVIVGGI